MAARIFLFFIAFIFLLTGFIYSVVLIYDHFTQDETETRTSQEINQERLDNLENLGSLADFEPLTEPLAEVRAETVAEGEGDLSVTETDVVTLKLTYALAGSGQIFRDYFFQSEDGVKHLDYTAGFQALLPCRNICWMSRSAASTAFSYRRTKRKHSFPSISSTCRRTRTSFWSWIWSGLPTGA